MTRLATVLTLVLTLVGASPALAQNALGDGTALDRNLQAGSGGVNAPQALPYTIDGGNAVITGNVTGTREFRGRIDYVAPGEFQGGVGSDDLFRFRAQSLPPGGAAPGAMIGPGGAGPTIVYRSSTGVSVADVLVTADPSLLSAQVNGLRVRPSTVEPTTLIAPAPQQGLALVRQADGSLLEITASPLLGVRRDVVSPAATESPAVPLPSAEAEPGARLPLPPPSLTLGLQLQGMLQPRGLEGETDGTRQREVVAGIEGSLFAPLQQVDEQAAAGDPYLSLLAQVQARRDGEGGPPPQAPTPPAGDAALTPPTPEQRAAAEAARVRAMQAARGLAAPPDAGAPAPTPALQQLVQALDYDLPAMSSLAAQREDRVNNLLRAGERAMAEARYFEAESHYRAALVASPTHPLARVGLVHAQLGAGLIRSAAFNLRLLLAEHPELIAARYDARLLPEPQRLRWVRGQVEQMLRLSTRPEPALVLAYLGYQQRLESLTAYGLDLAQARQPQDPLIPLLRRIWLQESSPGAGDPGRPTPTPVAP